jgi:anaerobic ribonucleoside-triphosphate reductase activating protein
MRYAGLIKNDVVNGEGVCVSFFVQGCPHHCPGCFNPQTWDFLGGSPLPANYKEQIADALIANGVKRNFSILGGEPLCEENYELTNEVCTFVREKFPDIKIFIWTGEEFDVLKKLSSHISVVSSILDKADVLITGPFVKEKKDLTLKLRGSSNQQIWRKINNKWIEVY